jgi:hypothetical protein
VAAASEDSGFVSSTTQDFRNLIRYNVIQCIMCAWIVRVNVFGPNLYPLVQWPSGCASCWYIRNV